VWEACLRATGTGGGLVTQLDARCPSETGLDGGATGRGLPAYATPRINRGVADRRVLFFGDSLVAGVGDPSGLGWTGRVVAASFATGTPLTAYNLGVRGQTSVEVAARCRHETRARLLCATDTRLVLSFGVNDTTVDVGQRRVEQTDSLGALEEVVGRAARLGVPVLVVGPAPVDDAEQNCRIQALSVAFSAACAEWGVPFVGVIDALLASDVWREEVSRRDGAHPEAGGYEALAELVIAGNWVEWLRSNDTGGTPTAQRLSAPPQPPCE
jgi:acyl-CoA thioesterase I